MLPRNYNVNVLDYLVSTFRHCTTNMGYTAEAINFYKVQVEGLVRISQVKATDVLLIYKVFGIDRDVQRVQKDVLERKLNSFCNVMQLCLKTNSLDEVQLLLFNLETSNRYDKDVIDVFFDIFGVKKVNKPSMDVDSLPTFGYFSDKSVITSSVDRQELLKKFKDCVFQVKNADAVCCSDPAYYYFTIQEILDENSVYANNRSLKQAVYAGTYAIGKLVTKDDRSACHTETTFIPEKKDTSVLIAFIKNHVLQNNLGSNVID